VHGFWSVEDFAELSDGPTGCGEMEELVFIYRGADKSLARPERKQATATEDFDFHISYL